MKIQLKRVYDPASKEDGVRILVERLWPRGIKKDELKMDAWLKDVAPSTELRKWFSHDPEKWEEFQKKYFMELDKNQRVIAALVSKLHKGTVTLLYSSKDVEHNNALSLKHYIESKMRKGSHSFFSD